MNHSTKCFLYFVLAVVFVSCKKPYLPPVIVAPNSYLVVEGVISSSDSTIIKLSKTVNLSSQVTTNPVLGAILTVESSQGTSFALTESKNGFYASAGISLNNTQQYRLRIKTADNKEYLSDFVAVLNSPAIDTISFAAKSNGLQINSGTHDATNTVKYFRWQFGETWVIHSKYFSFFKSNGDTVLGRDLINDNISQCWQSDSSSTILLGSSAKLAQDVVVDNPINFISSTSEKLGSKYSILLRQFALTGDAYKFWSNLQKNTQQLGSIFDAQPSEISGNIHSVTNPSETVIGYISVGSTSTKRIFISNSQLPAWVPTDPFPNCVDTALLYVFFGPGQKIPVNQIDQFINYKKGAIIPSLIPIDAISLPGHPPIGYTAAEPECVDCTLRGTNKQPPFWK